MSRMSDVWKTVLSLSFSGTVMILGIFLFCRIFHKKMSRRWQYYIWLVAVARLLVPFSGEINLTGRIFTELEQYTKQDGVFAEMEAVERNDVFTGTEAVEQNDAFTGSEPYIENDNIFTGSEQYTKQENGFVGEEADTEPGNRQGTENLQASADISSGLAVLWLAVAAFLLIRKISIYQSFMEFLRTDSEPVEPDLLERFGRIAEEMKIKGSIELRISHLAASPLLAGCLRPMVILPTEELSEKDFRYTVLHELTHYRRMDVLYKWLVQVAVCLHWFNPFAWLLGREVEKACELACDESVIEKLASDERRAYGDTLLHAAEAGVSWRRSVGAVTLHESGRLLKGRLEAIMEYRKRSKWVKALSMVLAVAITGSAAVMGAYAKPKMGTVQLPENTEKETHIPENAEDNDELRFSSGGNDFLLSDGTNVIERDRVFYILCDGVTEDKVPSAGVVDGTMIMVVHHDPDRSVTLSTSVTLSDGRSKILEEAKDICQQMQERGTLSEEDAERILETADELQKRERSMLHPDFFEGSYYQSAYYQAPYLFFVGYDLTEEAVKQYAGREIMLEDGEQLHISFADSDREWMEDEAFLKILSAQFSEFRRKTGKRVSAIRRPVISNVEELGYDAEALAAEYYVNGDIGRFSVMISELPADRQKEYLERAFWEKDAAVLSIVLDNLYESDDLEEELIDSYISRAYRNHDVAFFSILSDYLSEEALQEWYVRLKEENSWNSSWVVILRDLLEDTDEEEWKDEWWDDDWSW